MSAQIKYQLHTKTLYYTISSRLTGEVLGLVKKMQNELANIFQKKEDCAPIIKNHLEWHLKAPELEGKAIYKYAPNTIHFSILNIGKCDLNNVSFKKKREELEKEEWFPEFTRFITKEVLPEIKSQHFVFTIKRFYVPEEISGSIALNIFPNHPYAFFSKLEILENKIKNKLELLGQKEIRPKIKAFGEPYSHFPVNIFRFISDQDDCDPGREAIYNFLKTKNSEFKQLENSQKKTDQQKISFELEDPVFVISDPYLSNPRPTPSGRR